MKLAVITARGGSKRIPQKNIKEFCGKPIIAYSITAAINSNLFDEVMVSTDSPMIAEIAVKYGASVPFLRSKITSDDYATTDEVLMEVLFEYQKMGVHFDVMCCIYPTAPFITPSKLHQAMKLLEKSELKALMPVVQYAYPPQRACIIKNDTLVYQFPEYINTRSQDLTHIYHDCGQFYLHKIDENNEFCSETFIPLIVSELEVQDIDNEEDWKIAELKYQVMIYRTEVLE